MDFTWQNLAKLRFGFKPWHSSLFSHFQKYFFAFVTSFNKGKKAWPHYPAFKNGASVVSTAFQQRHHALKWCFLFFSLQVYVKSEIN